ncbi:MAG: CopD family protein [Candidatus Sericytochromatia bacterium]
MSGGSLYSWLKTAHIIGIIIWFSGMLWMPHLLLRIVESPSPEARIPLEGWARWMMKQMVTPAMLISLALGVGLLITHPGWLSMGWMHVKLLLVLLMTGYHGMLAASRRKISEGSRHLNATQLRRLVWVPVVILSLIVTLVVVKPF